MPASVCVYVLTDDCEFIGLVVDEAIVDTDSRGVMLTLVLGVGISNVNCVVVG